MNNPSPPGYIVQAAVEMARKSPCAKSKRGAAVFRYAPQIGTLPILGLGHNSIPERAVEHCNGSQACRQICRLRCVHAEQAALSRAAARMAADMRANALPPHFIELDVLHVKVATVRHESPAAAWEALELVPSGAPSCLPCASAILAAGAPARWAVGGVWLFHEGGWNRYTASEFHTRSVANVRDGVA